MLIKEAVEQKRLYKIASMLASGDLSTVEQGIELANAMGHDAELQRASSGFRKKEYNIFTSSEELYHQLRLLGPYSAGPVDLEGREFVITIRAR